MRSVRAMRAVARSYLLAAFFMVLAASEAGAASTVRDITLLPHEDGVRIVIDLGNKIPFQHRSFDHPPRLIIELPDVSWQIPERRAGRGYRMVKGFQFGRLRNNVSSLIIDVDRPFEIDTVFELPPSDSSGYRIVSHRSHPPAHECRHAPPARAVECLSERAGGSPSSAGTPPSIGGTAPTFEGRQRTARAKQAGVNRTATGTGTAVSGHTIEAYDRDRSRPWRH